MNAAAPPGKGPSPVPGSDELQRELAMRSDLTLYTLNQRFTIIGDWLLASRDVRERRAEQTRKETAQQTNESKLVEEFVAPPPPMPAFACRKTA